jgi:hypothetical protein
VVSAQFVGVYMGAIERGSTDREANTRRSQRITKFLLYLDRFHPWFPDVAPQSSINKSPTERRVVNFVILINLQQADQLRTLIWCV